MLFRDGAIAGQLSGRLGQAVASHNRYGSYFRAGTIPKTSTTDEAMAVKAVMTQVTQEWQGLTADERTAWQNWANSNPVVNRIGQSVNLTGHAAYVGLSARLAQAGITPPTTPPVIPAPAPMTTLSFTADIGPGGVIGTFTPVPSTGNTALYMKAAVVDSPGIQYVENYLRQIILAKTLPSSGGDFKTIIEARFPELTVDQKLVIVAGFWDFENGQLSALRRTDAVVVDTT